ncbi:MAG: tRNA (guanosine(37)-N1)-methyltransferase TrmD [Deltaproteobacteria bacterium]|nr:tRNA (guanosine(37)-N1)-methyltransferase TrmD [Deltaproteobacteria bacterium]
MKFTILSIHPKLAAAFAEEGLLAKAKAKGAVQIEAVDIRDFSDAPHHKVDDKTYGGGPGMILKPEPIARALQKIKSEAGVDSKIRTIVLSAKGKKFNQEAAHRLAKYDQLVFICGRYEGIDERIAEFYADEEICIGDYVMMGGEVAAAVVIETVARLLPNVIGNPKSLEAESFSSEIGTEYEQYTRPPVFEGHEVPAVLQNGNHKEIEKWRRKRQGDQGRSKK